MTEELQITEAAFDQILKNSSISLTMCSASSVSTQPSEEKSSIHENLIILLNSGRKITSLYNQNGISADKLSSINCEIYNNVNSILFHIPYSVELLYQLEITASQKI
jgi:hypothetical protein